ncbi:L-lysine exporter family protein LysE/ArgO [Arthrobacter pigmenti]|uniref:L-lysine exporter family protein LysE/ArgO n=1 Tax=Arthrobacter pigmenti TaxID=271432 RepID=A0A846RUQ8_9MICC|nr:L-lysine exporter family protein LysE/ArgO [Arthrobacter pigmenti]
MLDSTLTGFVAGLSLIIAIGSQNAFVLRQGLRRSHVALVVAVCALSDIALITLGVGGLGVVIEHAPVLLEVIRWAGAAFLLGYAVLAGLRAVRGEQLDVTKGRGCGSWRTALATCLALTWLNPHVYLDTVLLLGSLASTHGIQGRWWFAIGACAGSIVWFTALGVGARYLAPLFNRRLAWRILDGVIAAVMLALAISLIV